MNANMGQPNSGLDWDRGEKLIIWGIKNAGIELSGPDLEGFDSDEELSVKSSDNPGIMSSRPDLEGFSSYHIPESVLGEEGNY